MMLCIYASYIILISPHAFQISGENPACMTPFFPSVTEQPAFTVGQHSGSLQERRLSCYAYLSFSCLHSESLSLRHSNWQSVALSCLIVVKYLYALI